MIRITNGTLGIHGGNVNANVESTVSVRSAIRLVRATAGEALVIDRGTLTASSFDTWSGESNADTSDEPTRSRSFDWGEEEEDW